ncbi:MAG: 1,4-alpha-glucan branching protein GlgB [Planctomycetota bacterium]
MAILAPGSHGRGSLLTETDLHLFNEGTHYRLHEKLGSRPAELAGERGAYFAVWAPNAHYVSVIGDFNGWDRGANALTSRERSGIWEGFIPGLSAGTVYKYHVASHYQGYTVDKADPFAFRTEIPPKTASVVTPLDFEWGDGEWMAERRGHNHLHAPVSIYELHLGSWRRHEGWIYRELAEELAEHVKRAGFTHVEFLPLMEHPFYASWGYQTTGFFAPSSRYGAPQDFMYLVDHLHREGIGVILDWVPSHFPSDEHGLAYFDGTHLFEHADPRQGYHPDWKSYIFNYGRNEVRSFLISSALFWLERYHVDGLRVDAVASMLYNDYSRKGGDWIPNEYGGRENIGAIGFLRQLNTEIYRAFPDVQTFAEESTAWPQVSKPTDSGGLGFGLKWDMGWMHDTLLHMRREPIHRKHHHNELTFRGLYQFSENFVLPLSHDEVVHGKGSLLGRMPGDEWQRFANLRLLLVNQWAQPGKKLLFMGGELGQYSEWNHDGCLDWHLLEYAPHRGILALVRELNRIYREEPALHARDHDPAGFEWLEADDSAAGVIAFLRRGGAYGDEILAVMNYTPVVRDGYLLGVPSGGRWHEILNSDAEPFWGSGVGNLGSVESQPTPHKGYPHSLRVTVPPLGAVLLKRHGGEG